MTSHITANPFDSGADELERYALEECVKRQRIDRRISILVVTDKRGELAVKFARLGAQVVICDDAPLKGSIEGRILAAGQREEITFVAGTLNTLPDSLPGEPFDMIVVRRGLCGMRYAEARETIRQLMRKLRIGGKLYVSVLGLHSELGHDYADSELPIDRRFANLAPELADKYAIPGPVCLYTERNLFLLLLEAGASVLRTLTTTYGNIKGIAVRV